MVKACVAFCLLTLILAYLASPGILYYVLLRLGGLRRGVAAPVAAFHLFLLLLLFPCTELPAVVAVFASGMCAYAVFLLHRLWARCVIVAIAQGALIGVCATVSRPLIILGFCFLAVMTGAWIILRDWAIGADPKGGLEKY